MVTISQWQFERADYGGRSRHVSDDWNELDVETAIRAIGTLKISGQNSVFVIESETGTVLATVNM